MNSRSLRNAVVALSVLASVGAVSATARSGTSGIGSVRLPRISSVTVSDINDRGQVVGGLTKSYDDATRGFVWERGSLKVLGQGQFAGAKGINERGQILGTSGDEEHGVLWENGTMKKLGIEFAEKLNERGQILGGRNLVQTPGGGYAPNPALWTNGTVQLLPFAPGYPTAMNNLGQVVGQTTTGQAAEWQDGELTDLGAGSPIAINDHGEILGSLGQDVIVWRGGVVTDIGPGWPIALNERGEVIVSTLGTVTWPRALLWRNGTTTDLGTFGGKWSIPMAISDSGQVVGVSTDSNGRQHGFVWQNGVMTRLPSPAGYRGARTRALAINEHNQIIGDNCIWDCGENRSDPHPSRFAVLWTLRGYKVETRRLVDIRR